MGFSVLDINGKQKTTPGIIDLVTGASGVLTVPNGGTGLATLAAGRVPYGSGASALNSTGTLVFDGTKLTFPGQLQFPATQAASADANCLDDYEEGDWTPGLSFGGASTGITYSAVSNVASYTKSGRFVACSGLLLLTNKGSATGTARITGLPFVIGTSIKFVVGPKQGFTSMTLGVQEVGTQSEGGAATAIVVKSVPASDTNTNCTDADFTNTTAIIVYLCYFVD